MKEIETTVLSYLSERLDVPVSFEVPKGPPSLYVVLEKTGHTVDNKIHTTYIAAKSTGKSLVEVMRLNNRILEIMPGLVDEVDIFRCESQGDYDFTNTETKERRYQAIFEIVHV